MKSGDFCPRLDRVNPTPIVLKTANRTVNKELKQFPISLFF